MTEDLTTIPIYIRVRLLCIRSRRRKQSSSRSNESLSLQLKALLRMRLQRRWQMTASVAVAEVSRRMRSQCSSLLVLVLSLPKEEKTPTISSALKLGACRGPLTFTCRKRWMCKQRRLKPSEETRRVRTSSRLSRLHLKPRRRRQPGALSSVAFVTLPLQRAHAISGASGTNLHLKCTLVMTPTMRKRRAANKKPNAICVLMVVPLMSTHSPSCRQSMPWITRTKRRIEMIKTRRKILRHELVSLALHNPVIWNEA
mmetsp:Transcript_32096/g.84071  ORF Transcript_32096/g.84071 Transcript_32096/m.84071 type:complete len:256 (+) Transcript_32096:371-1138(+)